MNQIPSIGRIVLFALTKENAEQIEAKRWEFPAHRGNPVFEGEYLPMIVTGVWPGEYGEGTYGVNGQVILDGNDSLWITSAAEGAGPGKWQWPPRV